MPSINLKLQTLFFALLYFTFTICSYTTQKTNPFEADIESCVVKANFALQAIESEAEAIPEFKAKTPIKATALCTPKKLASATKNAQLKIEKRIDPEPTELEETSEISKAQSAENQKREESLDQEPKHDSGTKEQTARVKAVDRTEQNLGVIASFNKLMREYLAGVQTTASNAKNFLSSFSFGSVKLNFYQGFLLGQISVLATIFYFIKFLFLDDPGDNGANDKKFSEEPLAKQLGIDSYFGGSGISKFTFSKKVSKEKTQSKSEIEIKKLAEEILAKTSYNLSETPFETTGWLTVFIAQVYTKLRLDLERSGWLSRVITENLNGSLKPSVVDSIRITQLSLGSDFPRILAAKMSPSKGSFGMMSELNIEFIDGLSFGFDTQMVLNWPQKSFASLPVSLVLSVTKFIGTVIIELDYKNDLEIDISIKPGYVLDMNVQTLLGSNAKVQNLPMLTSLITRKLRHAFVSELVHPNSKRVQLKTPFFTDGATNENSQASTSANEQDNLSLSRKTKKESAQAAQRAQRAQSSGKWEPCSDTDPHISLSRDANNSMSTNGISKETYLQKNISENLNNGLHFSSSRMVPDDTIRISDTPRSVQIPAWYNTQLPPQNSFSLQKSNSFSHHKNPSNGYDDTRSDRYYNDVHGGLVSTLEHNRMNNYQSSSNNNTTGPNMNMNMNTGQNQPLTKSRSTYEKVANSDYAKFNNHGYSTFPNANVSSENNNLQGRVIYNYGNNNDDFDDSISSRHPLFPKSLARDLLKKKKQAAARKLSQSSKPKSQIQ